MKKLILLTICTILLLTGCGQAAAPEVDTVLAIVQEEATPPQLTHKMCRRE